MCAVKSQEMANSFSHMVEVIVRIYIIKTHDSESRGQEEAAVRDE